MVNANRVQEDKLFLEDPDNWPNWPVCPVKRYWPGYTWPEYGCVDAGSVKGRPIVMMLSLYDLPVSQELLNKTERHRYSSVDEMLEAGWVVD